MNADWPVKTIDELKADFRSAIAMGPFGSRIKAENFVTEGVPVLKGGNLHGAFIDDSKCDYLTEEKAEELKSSIAVTGDIVITHRGTIGQVSIIPENSRYPRYVVSQSQLKVSLNMELVNPLFVNYYLRSREGQHQLLSYSSQVGVPAIAKASTSVRQIRVPCPPIQVQNQIVSVLKVLDDKIELNRQTNQTLEQIAQAIFKSWFVDFEPTRAKIIAKEQGADPATQELAAQAVICGAITLEQLEKLEQNLETTLQNAINEKLTQENQTPINAEQLKATAALFPNELVESILGEVPGGWRVAKLDDLLEFNPRRTLKKGTLAPYLDMKNVPTEGHLANEVILREMTSGTRFINGDTLLARITPCLENGKTAYVDFLEEGQVAWGSTEYIIMRPKQGRPLSLGYFIARLDSFRSMAIQTMTGTSGRQRANAKALSEQLWIDYPIELLKAFDHIAGRYLAKAKQNGEESKILAELRDTLLPKLLSGELSVAETV